ncbi:uncharacterized protein EV420DRAFT_517904 [Desarmillaria tabescens]|uniref:Uncharacterized protein n=1 Tax=Armillaria tabescens TaxID=1929756 RepID=A0AA39N4N6_ARMTA|nr:uncharacterized protein EV420DRAFT_517904 [Desarmillaria tabescens]KAK0457294.1 hypothetical protein EV420DRAFT_517904 [Desarmillaria tabescens]
MSSEPKYTRPYIVLYDTEGGNGTYHWALIVHNPWLRLSSNISAYEIRREGNYSWDLNVNNRVRLLESSTLLCLVELPYISPSVARRFFARQSPSQGVTPLLLGQTDWNGAQWVIRCLDQAVQHQYLYSSLPACQSAHILYRCILYSKGKRFEDATYGRLFFDRMRSYEILSTVIDGSMFLMSDFEKFTCPAFSHTTHRS